MADLMLSYSQSKDSINIKDIEIICKTDIDGNFYSIFLYLKVHYVASRWLGFLLTKRTVIHFSFILVVSLPSTLHAFT